MNKSAASLDEFPIAQIPDTPWWSENYALMGSDLATQKALFFGSAVGMAIAASGANFS